MRELGAPLPCAWVLRDGGMLAWIEVEWPSDRRAARDGAGRAPTDTVSLLATLASRAAT